MVIWSGSKNIHYDDNINLSQTAFISSPWHKKYLWLKKDTPALVSPSLWEQILKVYHVPFHSLWNHPWCTAHLLAEKKSFGRTKKINKSHTYHCIPFMSSRALPSPAEIHSSRSHTNIWMTEWKCVVQVTTLCFSCLQISLKSIWLSPHSCPVEMKYKHYHEAGFKKCFSPSFSTGPTSHYLEFCFLKTTLITKWLSTLRCTRETSETAAGLHLNSQAIQKVLWVDLRGTSQTAFSVHSFGNSSSQTKILFHSNVLPSPGHTWNRAIAQLGQKRQPKGNDSTLPRSFYGYQINPRKMTK